MESNTLALFFSLESSADGGENAEITRSSKTRHEQYRWLGNPKLVLNKREGSCVI